METTDKQTGSSSPKTETAQNGQPKTGTASKEQPGDWKEKLTDKVTGDNDIFKSVLRQLTNPLTLLIATIAFFYWQYRKTAVKKATDKPDGKDDNAKGVDAAQQLKKQKKKNKRLKKQLQYQQQGNNFRNGSYHEQIA
jgi:hypothetical protein